VYYRGLALSGLLDLTPKARRDLLAQWRDVIGPAARRSS
jgi:hypothetical protein